MDSYIFYDRSTFFKSFWFRFRDVRWHGSRRCVFAAVFVRTNTFCTIGRTEPEQLHSVERWTRSRRFNSTVAWAKLYLVCFGNERAAIETRSFPL